VFDPCRPHAVFDAILDCCDHQEFTVARPELLPSFVPCVSTSAQIAGRVAKKIIACDTDTTVGSNGGRLGNSSKSRVHCKKVANSTGTTLPAT